MPSSKHPYTLLFLSVVVASTGAAAYAGDLPANPDYRIVRPSNTGIPGYVDMNFVAFDAQGRLWTTARDFFWQQGGVAALDFETEIWNTYSSEETPLDPESMAIDFAADGSAWIGSRDGQIVRLHPDGETFTTYNAANTGVLVDHAYETISIAPNGHVWASNPGQVDLGGGLFEFDGTTWTKHEEEWMESWTGFGYAPALNVIARSNGDVWASFISLPKRMGRYRDSEWTVYEGEPYIIAFAEHADGTLYGSSAFATYRYDDASEQWQQIGSSGSSRIALDHNSGDIYITPDLTSVRKFNGQTWSEFAAFPGWINSIGVRPDGDVWIAAETYSTHWSLHHYNSDGQIQRVYNRSNTGMPSYFAPWLGLDRDGRMWFTDAVYGASRLEPNENWRNFGIHNGEEEVYPGWVSPVSLPWWLQTPLASAWSEAPNQVYHDTQGNFWFRGPNWVARSQGEDLSQWTFWEPGQNGLPWLIDSIGEDADGNIWVGNEYSIIRLSGTTWIDEPVGLPDQFAPIDLRQGQDGELYATRVASVYRVEDLSTTLVYSMPTGWVTDVEVDAQGILWVGTPSNGLIRWDGSNETTYTPANSAMLENTVVDIAIRPSDGLIAVATSQQTTPPYTGGVALHDPATGEWIAYDYGSSFLPHYAVGDMQFDADGNLWVGVLNFGTVQVFLDEGEPDVIGDINDDGEVNVADLLMLLAAWGDCDNCPEDLDGDGAVNVTDLLMLLQSWG